MNPAEEEIDIQVQYQPMFEYLESEADIEIIEQPTASYSGTAQELRRASEGDRVFADTSPGAVAQIPDQLDVTGMRVAYGAEKYFSLITTTADSDIEELADLEGEFSRRPRRPLSPGPCSRCTCSATRGSTSGAHLPARPRTSSSGLQTTRPPANSSFQDDRIAAAGTGAFSTASHVPQEQFDEMSQEFVDISAEYDGAGEDDPELQLLAVSDPIPRAPIVSNAAWEESLKDDIRQLMIDAPQEAFEHDSQADIAEALNIDPEILDMDESELSEDQRRTSIWSRRTRSGSAASSKRAPKTTTPSRSSVKSSSRRSYETIRRHGRARRRVLRGPRRRVRHRARRLRIREVDAAPDAERAALPDGR